MNSTSKQAPVVLVTGAAHRLGRAIALNLAEAGWRVAVHYGQSAEAARETETTIQRSGGEAAVFRCNLSIEAEVNSLLDQVVARFGRVDAVVNNAGRFEFDDAHNFSGAMLEKHLGPNLVAPVILARNLARHLREQPGEHPGAVVNLLDQKLWNYNPDFFSYTLSKAALEAANTMLAQALAPHVRVIGVAPGLTLPSHMQSPEDFERTHAMAPLGRASRPQDIAHTVRFALTNPAITGTTLLVDGGQHLVGFQRDFSMMS